MEVLIFALKLLAGCLILTPFVGEIGCAWISHYFKVKVGVQEKIVTMVSEQLRMKGSTKKRVENS